jgi:hypothetical protein
VEGDIRAGSYSPGRNLGHEFVSFLNSPNSPVMLQQLGSGGMVTAYGPISDPGYCKIVSFNGDIADIDFNCFDQLGRPRDSSASAAWVTAQTQ